jgi:hypothetical protein
MEIDRLSNEIQIIQEQIKEVENEKKDEGVELDVLESILFELESRLDLETSRLNDLLKLKDYQESCSHVFIDDLIDITPDKSKMVTYCAHCLFTPVADSK